MRDDTLDKEKTFELLGACCFPYMADEYTMTEDERAALLALIHSNPDARNLAIALSMHTGLRTSETVALKRQDINLAEGTLLVTRAEIKCRITDTGKYAISTVECPENFSRRFVLSDEAVQVLEAALQINPQSEFLFTELGGKRRVTWEMLARRLREDCDAAEITRKHPAALRMSYAIDQMMGGADLETILTQLGLPNEMKKQK